MESVTQAAIPRRSSLTGTVTKSSGNMFERQNSYNPPVDFGPTQHRPHLGAAHSPTAPTSVPGAAHRSQDIPRNHSSTNRPSGMSSSTASTLPARHHHHHHSSHHLPTSSQSSQHPTNHHHHPEPYPKSAPPSSTSNKGGVRGRVTVVCAEVRFSFSLAIFVSFLRSLYVYCGSLTFAIFSSFFCSDAVSNSASASRSVYSFLS